MNFLSGGRDFGQTLKIENLQQRATRSKRVSVPENPYGWRHLSGFSIVVALFAQPEPTSSIALPRIVLKYIFGNREDAGFAFELNFAGRICRELDLPGLCA